MFHISYEPHEVSGEAGKWQVQSRKRRQFIKGYWNPQQLLPPPFLKKKKNQLLMFCGKQSWPE